MPERIRPWTSLWWGTDALLITDNTVGVIMVGAGMLSSQIGLVLSTVNDAQVKR